jgi:hypothetical protein
VLTQGRGLGIAAIVASQDYAGIMEADKKGAQQMVANTSVKVFMKLQDAENSSIMHNFIMRKFLILDLYQPNKGEARFTLPLQSFFILHDFVDYSDKIYVRRFGICRPACCLKNAVIFPAVLYVCETLSVTMKQEHRYLTTGCLGEDLDLRWLN